MIWGNPWGDPEKWDVIEILQSDTAKVDELVAQGYKYYRTFHDIDRRSLTHGQRTDVYRKRKPELPHSELCLCGECIRRMDKKACK